MLEQEADVAELVDVHLLKLIDREGGQGQGTYTSMNGPEPRATPSHPEPRLLPTRKGTVLGLLHKDHKASSGYRSQSFMLGKPPKGFWMWSLDTRDPHVTSLMNAPTKPKKQKTPKPNAFGHGKETRFAASCQEPGVPS